MQEEVNQRTAELIVRDFELSAPEQEVGEEELFAMLAEQIAYMIEDRLEYLLSLMYRLDISEAKVNFALSPMAPELPHIGLARLVMERQKQRISTKLEYKQPMLDDLEEGLEF